MKSSYSKVGIFLFSILLGILCIGFCLDNKNAERIGLCGLVFYAVVGGIGYGSRRTKALAFAVAALLLLIVWQDYEIQGAQYVEEVHALKVKLHVVQYQLDLRRNSQSASS